MKTNPDSIRRSIRKISTAVLLGMAVQIASPISTLLAEETPHRATKVSVTQADENADFALFVPMNRAEGAIHGVQLVGERAETAINWEPAFWKKLPFFFPLHDAAKRVQVSSVAAVAATAMPFAAANYGSQGVPRAKLLPQMVVMSREVRKVDLWREFSERMVVDLQPMLPSGADLEARRIKLPTDRAATSLIDRFVPRSSLWQSLHDDRHQLPRDLSSDTVVAFRIVYQNLGGNRNPNPAMTLSMELEGRVIRVDGKRELKTFRIQHERAAKKFAEWSAHDAELFHAEWNEAIESLVEQAGQQVKEFLLPEVKMVKVLEKPAATMLATAR